MSNPYKTREGGATVTIFVPYDCNNHCPFCINKQEYADTSSFSLERICESIRTMDAITPRCDFVFTGGEPMANLESLQVMLDCIPATHRIFINTTLPVMHSYTEDEVVAFLNRNKDKLTCVNVSRHLFPFV
ncbi:MAG: 4Fe-4S cluster-binding domain-containing protein, partial [Ruminococcaceae bacterium]|nr:4Fe-4S cluster-binding domain-containing protein [Oscillospiraceae bacterium]